MLAMRQNAPATWRLPFVPLLLLIIQQLPGLLQRVSDCKRGFLYLPQSPIGPFANSMTDLHRLILTADPDFTDLALEELQPSAKDAAILATLAPGVLLVQLGEPFIPFAERWLQNPPIFVRHICPADLVIPLQGDRESDLAELRTQVLDQIAPLLDPARALSVQTRIFADLPYKPYDLNTTLAGALHQQTGVPINVRTPEQVLSVVCAELPGGWSTGKQGSNPKSILLGLSLTEQNLSDWAGGVHRFGREEGQISRAEFKLLEALDVFHITLPPRGVALDLGASPGGWTRVLRQHDQYVTAVDPGDLNPRLTRDRGVRHKRTTAEAYLAANPDQFDLIVNDMRMDARDSARLMVAYARQLYPHGFALMTLKLPAQNRRNVIEHAFKLLRQSYEIVGARQLFHNRSEITVYLRPQGAHHGLDIL